jgi:hypothetical protein
VAGGPADAYSGIQALVEVEGVVTQVLVVLSEAAETPWVNNRQQQDESVENKYVYIL